MGFNVGRQAVGQAQGDAAVAGANGPVAGHFRSGQNLGGDAAVARFKPERVKAPPDAHVAIVCGRVEGAVHGRAFDVAIAGVEQHGAAQVAHLDASVAAFNMDFSVHAGAVNVAVAGMDIQVGVARNGELDAHGAIVDAPGPVRAGHSNGDFDVVARLDVALDAHVVLRDGVAGGDDAGGHLG